MDLDVMVGTWKWAAAGNRKLYDLLLNIMSDDALLVVEALPEQGFEAWRQLKLRYDPKSGTFELDRMLQLMTRKQCANLGELPAAIDQLEKDMRNYELRSPNPFPKSGQFLCAFSWSRKPISTKLK